MNSQDMDEWVYFNKLRNIWNYARGFFFSVCNVCTFPLISKFGPLSSSNPRCAHAEIRNRKSQLYFSRVTDLVILVKNIFLGKVQSWCSVFGLIKGHYSKFFSISNLKITLFHLFWCISLQSLTVLITMILEINYYGLMVCVTLHLIISGERMLWIWNYMHSLY